MHMSRDFSAATIRDNLPIPGADDDKYTRGVVGLRTGSPAYPGAAVLSSEGAWRAGAGMVRWVGDAGVAALVLARRPETVVHTGRVQAWVAGSGTDPAVRAAEDTAAIEALLDGEVPVVLDAGALDLARPSAAPLVVTPHAGEFARLAERLQLAPSAQGADAASEVVQVARTLQAIVVRKGADTIVAGPDGTVVHLHAGTGWLATAGTGDVLSGVVGSIVAQANARSERSGGDVLSATALFAAVATAVVLHGRAGRIASHADDAGGFPITALDVAEALPAAARALRLER